MTALITIVLVVMTFVVPRKYILLPYVLGACFAPADQTLMIGELNFQVLRILVGWWACCGWHCAGRSSLSGGTTSTS